MKPVDQTKFGYPEGNCFSACVASLLELDLSEVPFFMGREDWWEAFARWLYPRGLYPLHFPMRVDGLGPPGLYIAGGASPRDPQYMHAVVARGREIVHDPNPSRLGLVSIEDVTLLVSLELRESVTLGTIERLLGENGCNCDCDHHWEEHDVDCVRCFACEVGHVLQPEFAR